MAQVLLHAFHHSFTTKLQPEEVEQLCLLNQTQLAPFISRLKELEKQYASNADGEGFLPDSMTEDFVRLKNDILATSRQNRNQPPLFQLNRPEVLTLPPVEHIRVPVELRPTSEHDANGQTASLMFEKFKQILESYNIPADHKSRFVQSPTGAKFEPRQIRFVIVGNNRFLQHVISAYTTIQSQYPDIGHGLECKFYLAPCTRNDVANYLARHDLWYHRYIFTPFRSPFPYLVPWTRQDEVIGDRSSVLSLPSQYLRQSILQYTRESQNNLNLVVFKLEARYDPSSREATETVSFVQRVEIGIAPAITEYKAKTPTAVALKTEEIMKDKNFLYQAPELQVKYHKVNCTGAPQVEVVDDIVGYQSIVVSNISRKTDQGAASDPTSPNLELYRQPLSKADKTKLVKPGMLCFDPHLLVSSVTLTCNTNNGFRVLIDDSLRGPYRSITISPAVLQSTGQIARFPIQTFFPLACANHKK